MVGLRTKETNDAYKQWDVNNHTKGCVLCDRESITSFQHWKIIRNDFPYDRIAQTHHMLVPKRHVPGDYRSLSEDEIAELNTVKQEYLNDHYEYVFEALNHMQTIPEHFHLHLIVVKEE